MSGSGGGNQQSYSQQQSQSTSEPPAFIKPYLQTGIGDLASLYESNKSAPGYYPGSTVAPLSWGTNKAIAGTYDRALNGSPLVRGAQQQTLDTINGKYLDPNSNPYWQGAVDAALKPQTEQFMNTIIPGITSAFEGSGRTGSGLHQAAVDQATTNFSRAQADARVKAANDQYNTARGQQIDAVNNAPNLANQDYVDLGQLAQAGGAIDNYSQRQIDADVARYNYNNNGQWNYIARYLGMLNGGYPGGQTSGTSSGTSIQPQQSSSPLGAIMGGAGLALQAAPLFGFSDARVKDIHSRVGQTDDGTPLYLYTYKGETDPRVGPMAQEVAQTNPDAVAKHPSGYLMVDYNKVAQRSRGFI